MSDQTPRNPENGPKALPQPAKTAPATAQLPAELTRLHSVLASIFARFTKRQVILAIGIAAVSDLLSAFVTFAPPLVWIVDFATAVLLFVVLGWQWLLLPGLFMEAIPGVGVIAFWLLVVAGIIIWGTARPKFNRSFLEDTREPAHKG